MASSVVGSTEALTSNDVVVPVVIKLTGASAVVVQKLATHQDIVAYLERFALVEISGPLRFELSAPVSSTVAATIIAAVYPDKYPDQPTTAHQIRRLEGRIAAKDALLVPAELHVEGRVRQVSHCLSHATLTDYPPVLAVALGVAGGTAATETYLTVHVPLRCSGIAHRKTW